MKKIFLISALFLGTLLTNAQEIGPRVEPSNNEALKVTFFHDNGNTMHEGEYVNGKSEGLWSSYDEQGRLKAKGEYTNGKKTGKWLFVTQNEKKEVLYMNNSIVDIKKLKTETLVSN
jgi:hypothetical protein